MDYVSDGKEFEPGSSSDYLDVKRAFLNATYDENINRDLWLLEHTNKGEFDHAYEILDNQTTTEIETEENYIELLEQN